MEQWRFIVYCSSSCCFCCSMWFSEIVTRVQILISLAHHPPNLCSRVNWTTYMQWTGMEREQNHWTLLQTCCFPDGTILSFGIFTYTPLPKWPTWSKTSSWGVSHICRFVHRTWWISWLCSFEPHSVVPLFKLNSPLKFCHVLPFMHSLCFLAI